MKKVFIGLLIIAAGAGTYYFLQKKKTENANTIQKELLTGKWKFKSVVSNDSSYNLPGLLIALDSNLMKYRYDFKADGNIITSVADSVKADTSHYEWIKKDQLVLKEKLTDSTGQTFTVTKLTIDSLLLQSIDSTLLVFTKIK